MSCAAGAGEVTERIRERAETTIIPLAPGKAGPADGVGRLRGGAGDGDEGVLLVKAADDALYRAKLAGRNQAVGRPALPAEKSAMAVRRRRGKAIAS